MSNNMDVDDEEWLGDVAEETGDPKTGSKTEPKTQGKLGKAIGVLKINLQEKIEKKGIRQDANASSAQSRRKPTRGSVPIIPKQLM